MLFRTRYNVLFRQFRLLTAQAGSIPAAIRLIFENCYISSEAAKSFYVMASSRGWKTQEPIRIKQERPTLFEQLVFRAVSEGEISIQQGGRIVKDTLRLRAFALSI